MCTTLAELLRKTMNNIEVAVYMPDETAKKFLIFQEYYDAFSLLVERGVFEQKNAAISLHFDQNGTLQTIQRADFLYSRKHELGNPIS